MKTIDQTVIPLDADTQAVLDALATGKRLDPEVAERLRKETDDLREQVFRKHGVLDIGVPAIRELRGELPSP
jgi:hypothetical protein